MSGLPGKAASFWIASTPETNYPALTRDLSVDVAIVGAGLVGITAAKLLKQAGKTVAVLESDRISHGTSGHTTAKLTSQHHLIYADLIEKIGADGAGLYGESNQAAVEQVASFVAAENIDCDFERKNAHVYATTASDREKIEAEVEAALKLGLPASFVTEANLPFPITGAVRFDNQAQFHPRKYILHLAKTVHGDGSVICENTRVMTVEEEQPCRVITKNGPTVTATDVIVATNLPILDQGLYFAKSYPKRSYLIGARIGADKDPGGMFIGAGEITKSIRTTPHPDGGLLLLVGGGGHKVGEASDTDDRYRRLDEFMRSQFGVSTEYRWSTQDMVSFDRLPYIGRLTPANNHIYVATAFSLWGMSKSTLSAMILSDLILGVKNPWADLYDSLRPTPFVSQESVKENLDVGMRWFGDRLKGLFKSPDDLSPGNAELMTVNGNKIAAYCDEAGHLHQVSAVCPHLACIVAWNPAEKSWDCPCHGSRFDIDGQLLRGPAVKDLHREG